MQFVPYKRPNHTLIRFFGLRFFSLPESFFGRTIFQPPRLVLQFSAIYKHRVARKRYSVVRIADDEVAAAGLNGYIGILLAAAVFDGGADSCAAAGAAGACLAVAAFKDAELEHGGIYDAHELGICTVREERRIFE